MSAVNPVLENKISLEKYGCQKLTATDGSRRFSYSIQCVEDDKIDGKKEIGLVRKTGR